MALLSLFDHLYCQEENLEEFGEEEFEQSMPATLLLTPCESERHLLSATEVEPEEEWTELLCSLLSKEGEFLPKPFPNGGYFSSLQSTRKVAVEWVARPARRHDFSALTALLAVNYRVLEYDLGLLQISGSAVILREGKEVVRIKYYDVQN
ncbi:cyclin-D3-2-like [Zingiber officinale]|uniref:cyclin-D3-2-like n=1 Tax=Zingiber officinale TaxID=94328 RepID=UPI001C4AEEF3|nr:cyclin-D3-2-like [Zingiber officinale]